MSDKINQEICRRTFTEDLLDIYDLLEVMAALRKPYTGCPWDLKQSFKSIAPFTIEEAYEVADAIEKNDIPALKEELGDLLFQVVYHARIAEEKKEFDFGEVVDTVTRKMIRRHPHVFGDEETRASFELEGFWERMKAQEKSDGQVSGEGSSVLDDVVSTFPALTRAQKLQSKAARAGFDWPSIEPVLDKISEELGELKHEIEAGADDDRISEEYGDLMFVMANLARHLKLDAEASLRSANEKFVRRFRRIEDLLASKGKTPSQSTLEEMDSLWSQVKVEETVKGTGDVD